MMTQKEIRESFLNFFYSKGHEFVSSASLVPKQDPTILFNNSGMSQFKDIFLSLQEPKYLRVCNSQKCIRLSGKHNDLEEVGVDTYHHTFFEMLGNWSFGDFYKKEIIAWAWELLTEIWKLPKKKLYATVYKDDQEAADLWKSETDIDHTNIQYFGEKENFWEMAEVGPCGPCSEIHIDIGEECCTCSSDKKQYCKSHPGAGVNQDCGRYIEIWNLVFIQYNREKGGSLTRLKKSFVDTGMGFERICAVLQNKKSNYDTDVFANLFQEISTLTNLKYDEIPLAQQIAFRVIADHIRAISFSIADGITPSNEGRGYVIRRILRRAYRYGRELELNTPFLHKIVPSVVKTMGGFFPEIKDRESHVVSTIKMEEEAFHKTLDKGLLLFKKLIDQESKTKLLPGKEVFQLYDTYGFPLDLTMLLATEQGYRVDEVGFEKEMDKQKKQSKKKELDHDLIKVVAEHQFKTIYSGDQKSFCIGKVLLTLANKKKIVELKAGMEGVLVLDETVFYGESGGQIGDVGKVNKFDNNKNEIAIFQVNDTQKLKDTYLLFGEVTLGSFTSGDECEQNVDWSRKNHIRKNHSATHIMHRALCEALGDHVQQSGSLVNDEKLRFDFNHPQPMKEEEVHAVERRVNEIIAKNLQLEIKEMNYDDAIERGAKAFFEEKYGDRVRVVAMGDYSIELCGGSHVHATGEIGGFRIMSETSVASGIRRIEAITGTALMEDYYSQVKTLEKIKHILGVNDTEQLLEKIVHMQTNMSQFNQDRKLLEENNLKFTIQGSRRNFGEASVYLKKFTQVDDAGEFINLLKRQIDNVKNHDHQAICFFAVYDEKKVTFLSGVGKNLTDKIKAGELVKGAAKLCGGNGGGRDDFAQAGGQEVREVNKAVTWVQDFIKKTIG